MDVGKNSCKAETEGSSACFPSDVSDQEEMPKASEGKADGGVAQT